MNRDFAFPQKRTRADCRQNAFNCQHLNGWLEPIHFHFHLFQPLVPKPECNTLKCRLILPKCNQQIVPVSQILKRKLTKASRNGHPQADRQWWEKKTFQMWQKMIFIIKQQYLHKSPAAFKFYFKSVQVVDVIKSYNWSRIISLSVTLYYTYSTYHLYITYGVVPFRSRM